MHIEGADFVREVREEHASDSRSSVHDDKEPKRLKRFVGRFGGAYWGACPVASAKAAH